VELLKTTDYEILSAIREDPTIGNPQIAKRFAVKTKRVSKLRRSICAPKAGPPIQSGSYFIADEHNRVKIGKSIDVAHRLTKLQIGNADTLTLLGVTDKDECELHVKFAKYHIRGEWFALSTEIQEFIDQL